MTDVLFVVTHLHGIGHLRRTAVLARACAARGLAVTLVSGGRPLRGLELDNVRWLQLEPWLRSRDESFRELLGPDDAPLDDGMREKRRTGLLAILAQEQPHILVTEQFPFGRGKLRFELSPLIAATQAMTPRPRIVCSVRDLLVQKPAQKTLWMAEAAAAYDRILVHGDAALIPFEASFAQTSAIAGKLLYTGYVSEPVLPAAEPPRGEVLVSAGGGAFGRDFLFSALRARPLSRACDLPWRLLVGDNLPETDFRALGQTVPEGVTVQRAQPDFPAWLGHCALSISQGGYNTVVDILRAGCPAVVVPYQEGGQSEQRKRADLLDAGGWLTSAPGGDHDPSLLAAAIDRRLNAAEQVPAHGGSTLPNLNGAEATAEILEDLAVIVPPAE
ncbi:glycosyltransferase family protein [Algihabitans albus]|uniref:glycosyltransferase family protein n=1 Tax=Algihabitans albus TaxID=2164067 RepID=UPI000E5CF316|nr:glycosyltransferase [Algihabitans albus]